VRDQSAALKAVASEARAGTRGAVLLAGAAGTAAAQAADTVAAELRTTVFHIDLAAVVSKYIGETEKNIDALFADAEGAGAVLLIDEADALFGKRSGVKDAHDRYANIDLSALLSRIESYQGVALLATSLGTNIDPAFSRRLRRVIDYTPRKA
jgi:SpoVK/Ycf46/Vps4 family AAA+-type ATPase